MFVLNVGKHLSRLLGFVLKFTLMTFMENLYFCNYAVVGDC